MVACGYADEYIEQILISEQLVLAGTSRPGALTYAYDYGRNSDPVKHGMPQAVYVLFRIADDRWAKAD